MLWDLVYLIQHTMDFNRKCNGVRASYKHIQKQVWNQRIYKQQYRIQCAEHNAVEVSFVYNFHSYATHGLVSQSAICSAPNYFIVPHWCSAHLSFYYIRIQVILLSIYLRCMLSPTIKRAMGKLCLAIYSLSLILLCSSLSQNLSGCMYVSVLIYVRWWAVYTFFFRHRHRRRRWHYSSRDALI